MRWAGPVPLPLFAGVDRAEPRGACRQTRGVIDALGE